MHPHRIVVGLAGVSDDYIWDTVQYGKLELWMSTSMNEVKRSSITAHTPHAMPCHHLLLDSSLPAFSEEILYVIERTFLGPSPRHGY